MDDVRAVLRRYSLEGFPSGLGGCRSPHGGRGGRAGGGPHPCCEYNVSVFDDRDEPDTVAEAEGGGGPAVCIHHCSLSETRSNVLAHIDGLDVVNDDGWELRTALVHLRERRAGILADYSRNCLADALFCASRASGPAAAPAGLAACWAKCAALYLADAVLLANGKRPRPAHLLHDARSLPGSGPAADLFGVVRECAGAERASPVLLGRMAEAAAGLSDLTEGNGRSAIIRAKADYLAGESMHAECYFYLCHTCRGILARHAGMVQGRPGLPRILRTALDAEADGRDAERHAGAVRAAAERMLSERPGNY